MNVRVAKGFKNPGSSDATRVGLPDSEPQIISTRANGGGGLQYAVGDDTQDPRRFRRFPSSLVDIVEGHFD